VSCYSHDLGAAKPDPAFFVEAAARIGDVPEAILFVDDSAANVEGARTAGMPALHWDVTRGHDVLLAQLREHGVVISPADGSPS
jgi:putative hydrolase of the HAD superfamily